MSPAQLAAAGSLSSSRWGTARAFSLPLSAAKRSAPRCKPRHPHPQTLFAKFLTLILPPEGVAGLRGTRGHFLMLRPPGCRHPVLNGTPEAGFIGHESFCLKAEDQGPGPSQTEPRMERTWIKTGAACPRPPAPALKQPASGRPGWLLWDRTGHRGGFGELGSPPCRSNPMTFLTVFIVPGIKGRLEGPDTGPRHSVRMLGPDAGARRWAGH